MHQFRFVSLILCVFFALVSEPIRAQVGPGSFDVFLSSAPDKGKPRLFFVDARTGLSNIAMTNGTRHTLVDQGVLFQEADTNFIKIAYADGRTELFTAMQSPDPKATIKWVVSGNRKRIAWSVSTVSGASLLSDLYTASADGSDKKLVLHTSSTKNLITVPLAITDDGASAFYSRQNLTPGDYQLFPVAGDVFQLDLATGRTTPLPDEAKCACGVGFSTNGRLFARLESTNGQGFALRVWDLSIKTDTLVKPSLLPHAQAGYIVLSADGSLAIYTSARGVRPVKGGVPERYALVLADLSRHEQRLMTDALPDNLRAVAFQRDNSAVLAVGVNNDGTYKLSLTDGTLQPVSVYTYLGTITG